MNIAKEVKVIFQNDYLEFIDAESVQGVVLGETDNFIIFGKIEERILIGKKFIVKMTEVKKSGSPFFELGN